MKQETSFIVDPGKLLISGITCAGMLLIAFAMLSVEKPIGFFLFLLLGLLYLFVALKNGSAITFSSRGIEKQLLGKPLKTVPWNSIAEIGITGTRVFPASQPGNTGRMYFYFSEKKMTEDERFEMALSWPPRRKLYLLYQADRLEALRRFWSGAIVNHHAGDIEL